MALIWGVCVIGMLKPWQNRQNTKRGNKRDVTNESRNVRSAMPRQWKQKGAQDSITRERMKRNRLEATTDNESDSTVHRYPLTRNRSQSVFTPYSNHFLINRRLVQSRDRDIHHKEVFLFKYTSFYCCQIWRNSWRHK